MNLALFSLIELTSDSFNNFAQGLRTRIKIFCAVANLKQNQKYLDKGIS